MQVKRRTRIYIGGKNFARKYFAKYSCEVVFFSDLFSRMPTVRLRVHLTRS